MWVGLGHAEDWVLDTLSLVGGEKYMVVDIGGVRAGNTGLDELRLRLDLDLEIFSPAVLICCMSWSDENLYSRRDGFTQRALFPKPFLSRL